MPESPDLQPTPLDALHRELGARMVAFAGYRLPVRFEGIIAEHLQARAGAALFDVSHIGQARLRGAGAAAALEALAPIDLDGVPAGRSLYTVLTNDDGGIIDDLVVTNGGDHLYLVVNAARRAQDFARIRAHLGADGEIEELSDRAMLSLQGPAAGEVLARFAPASRHIAFMNGANLTVANVPCFVTRGGYTGEDGFELSLPGADAEPVARLLLAEPEVRPAGLGARDTLRLEAGHCQWGNDIDETTTPVEAGLAWTIGKRRRAEGGYPGAEVIKRQLADGPARRRVGLGPEGRVPARAGAPVRVPGGAVVGRVTSGAHGPSVGTPVAMGYVTAGHAAPGTRLDIEVRGKALSARVVKLPFVEHRYKR